MKHSAFVVASLFLASSCSAAQAELARMEELPQIVAEDADGSESAPSDPADEQTDADMGDGPPDRAEPPDETGEPSGDEADTPGEPVEPEPTVPTGVPSIQPTIIARYPHDGAAFTQGLEFADGVLIESLGLVGESTRRRVEPTTGEVIGSARMDNDQFGAGLTIVDNKVIQLTWRQGVAVVSDLTTLIEVGRVEYDGEGWGLCSLEDGRLAMSNGSGFLTFRDATTFEPAGELEVTLDGEPVENLNELECVGSSIYANVWLENDILEIDAATGTVTRVIDATALVPGDLAPDDVLNGIAHRPETDTFFLTGKRWTVMYEVTFG